LPATKKPHRRSRRKRLLALGGAFFLAFALVLFAGDGLVHYNKIHSGVAIAGYDVGGLTREEAVEQLDARAQRAQASAIILKGDGQEWPVMPTSLGTVLDVKSSVQAAFSSTRERNIFRDASRRFALYFTELDLPLHGTIESERLKTLIAEVAQTLDKPPVNASLTVNEGHVRITEGSDGFVVDQEKLKTDLKSLLFSLHATDLPVPMTVREPAIKGADTAEAVAEAETMISDNVALEYQDQVWTLDPAQIAAYLDFAVEGEGDRARLIPIISAAKSEPVLTEAGEKIDHPAKKATWETNGETATIVPHQNGLAVDHEKTAAALTTAAKSTSNRVADAVVTETEPQRTTEEAENMGIEVALGRFNTEFGGSDNRRDNVQRAAELINGTLIGPGETFDFNTVVGQRTADNGFKTAPVIIGGKLEDSLGGGICQVSTTLYNAVFFGGLDVTARANHSLYISHYPKGRDATVSWGGPEFQFRNDTDSWILIKSASSRSSLTFAIYGKPTGRTVDYSTGDWYDVQPPTETRVKTDELLEGQTRLVDEGQTGRKIKVTRKVTADGKVIHDDTFVSNYPMKPKVIEVGTKPAPTTTTAPPKSSSPPKSSTSTTEAKSTTVNTAAN